MKKKLLGVVGIGVLTMSMLAGCGKPEPILFEGKELMPDRVEEILEDRLEDENGLDFEVDLYEEVEE